MVDVLRLVVLLLLLLTLCTKKLKNVIKSGLDSLGLVSLTSEALLSAMTWLAAHKTRSQLSEQIRTSDGMMHSGFESRKNVPRNDE